jgi:uncharacterized membrane protein YqjE
MSTTERTLGLLASLRQLLGTALATAQVRLALISNEIEQEKIRLFDSLLWTWLGLLLLGLSAQLLAAFVVLLFWDSNRLLALGTLFIVFLVSGSVFLWLAYRRLRQPGGLFSTSVDELGRDHLALGEGKT